MGSSTENLLKQYGLRKTSARIATLDILIRSDVALAHSDIEQALKEDLDRVTLYRTLSVFEEKGLIHKAYDGGEAVKYAICSSACNEHEHKDDHLHFNCQVCGNTYCLQGYSVPQIESPADFEIEHVYLFAKGICKACRS